MAVNLLEEDQLVYHDEDADTLQITVLSNCPGEMNFTCVDAYQDQEITVIVNNRGAVETIRDALTCWLETGKLK